MKIPILLITALTSVSSLSAQTKINESKIVAEGKILYKSEMASWYGTDLFSERFKEKKATIGGYFSYSDNKVSKCIFFSKSAKVIGTITFDSTFNVKTANVDGFEREFTPTETELYLIRKKALQAVNTDTLFKRYHNADLNLIPIVDNEVKRVYVLTAPRVNGVVLLGNDYLLKFDRLNNLIETKKLHKNLIPIPYTGGAEKVGSHTHLPETGDLITSTDICTLMLYGKFANWKQHYVISNNLVSIWDCEKDILSTMPKAEWESRNNK
jgi:hypothetical protein